MARKPLDTKTKIIIGVFLGLIVLAVLVAAAGTSTDPDVRYNYTVTIADVPPGNPYAKPGGSEYVTMHLTIKNDRMSSVTTNPLNWQFKLVTENGMRYGSSIHTFGHPSYELVEIPRGGWGTTVQVFEVPKIIGTDFHFELDYLGYGRVVYDPDLDY